MQKNQVVVCGHTDLEIYEAGKICNVINWRHPERTMDANVFFGGTGRSPSGQRGWN